MTFYIYDPETGDATEVPGRELTCTNDGCGNAAYAVESGHGIMLADDGSQVVCGGDFVEADGTVRACGAILASVTPE